MAATRIAIVGLGKIAQDQHVPVIEASEAFELAAIVSTRGATVGGLPSFATLGELLRERPDIEAVSICTPPTAHHAAVREALLAGRAVFLEKPPATTLSEVADLAALAAKGRHVLFATWHSRFNPGVERARALLAGQHLTRLAVTWKESVWRWHPGQDWVWQPGGFGVFDPGINALSIVTHIVPRPIFVTDATLTFPEGRDTPIAASLVFRSSEPHAPLTAEFDWRQRGDQTWTIEAETDEGTRLALLDGGARLVVDGTEEAMPAGGGVLASEYGRLYARFAELIAEGRSEVDDAPLRLVADAFLLGRRVAGEPFAWEDRGEVGNPAEAPVVRLQDAEDQPMSQPDTPRDFGDSAGYGGGGSEKDYHDVGDTPEPRKPNPLDAVMKDAAKDTSGRGTPPAAGPHAEPGLTDASRTPGTGALPDTSDGEADAGVG